MRKLNILVTAGPTREKIDPVRFLSNLSTGEMGYAIARLAKQMGHRVTLISGPTAIRPPKGAGFIPVTSARDLKRAVDACWKRTDVLIMTAAVSDYTPKKYSCEKLKRIGNRTIYLIKTPDILKSVAGRKGRKLVVGFCLETSGVEENAGRKLKDKNLDLIVANWYGPDNNPFGLGRFSMILIGADGRRKKHVGVTKRQAAGFILRRVMEIAQGGQGKCLKNSEK